MTYENWENHFATSLTKSITEDLKSYKSSRHIWVKDMSKQYLKWKQWQAYVKHSGSALINPMLI